MIESDEPEDPVAARLDEIIEALGSMSEDDDFTAIDAELEAIEAMTAEGDQPPEPAAVQPEPVDQAQPPADQVPTPVPQASSATRIDRLRGAIGRQNPGMSAADWLASTVRTPVTAAEAMANAEQARQGRVAAARDAERANIESAKARGRLGKF